MAQVRCQIRTLEFHVIDFPAIIGEIIFTITIGGVRSDFPSSLDRMFQKSYPSFYSQLEIIGLRMHREPGKGKTTEAEVQEYFRAKFIGYVLYLLLSLYLESSYQQRLRLLKGDEDTPEEDWRKLFEYCDGGFRHQ